jgi:hypothetical protein
LIPCDATHAFLSDASYEGTIGGWLPAFLVMWHLTPEDLLLLGFQLKLVTAADGEPDYDATGLNIHPFKFIGCIINLWLLLQLIKTLPPCEMGYIVDFLLDNTSALSWLKVMAATRNRDLQRSPVTIYDLAMHAQKKAYLHPYLHELISQCSNWMQLKPRKEPYMYCMLATQPCFLACSTLPPTKMFLHKEYVVWDWS